jgi:predicted nucleic acid-binding protein
MGELYWPRRQDWPSLVDQKDWWALDLAWASEADFIVTRDKAILRAGKKLKLAVLEPPELLAILES